MKNKIFMLVFVVLLSATAFASPGIIIYSNGTIGDSTPHYRIWNTTNFSAPKSTGVHLGASPGMLKVVTNPIRNEAIMGSLTANISFAVYNATEDTWGNIINVSSDGFSVGTMAFDIAYESLSGRAIAIYKNGTGDTAAAYRIWNGTGWSIDSLTASDGCSGFPTWIRAESVPKTNHIVMVDHNVTTGDICAQIWNGTEWGNTTTLTLNGETTTPKRIFDISPEYQSGRVMVVFAEDTRTTANYTLWNSSSLSWTPQGNIPAGSLSLDVTMQWLDLGSDYESSRIVHGRIDDDTDVSIWHWNGTEWGTGSEPDISIETFDYKDVAAGFAGFNGTVLYGGGAAGDSDFAHVRCTSQTNCQQGIWTSASTVSGCSANVNWVSMHQDPGNKSQAMAVTVAQGSTNNVCIRQFNNSGWSRTTVAGSTSNINVESASFAYFSAPGRLNVSLNLPTGLLEVLQNRTFFANATVTCIGLVGASCGVSYAALRYNLSESTPNHNVSTRYNLSFYISNFTGGKDHWGTLWNRTENPSLSVDDANRIAVDSNGNMAVVGHQDVFWRVMYLNSSGVSLWNRTFFTTSGQPKDVDIDSNGNIVVVGSSGLGWLIMYFNSSGANLWNRTEALGPGADSANGVAFDSTGNITVVGDNNGEIWQIMYFNSSGVSLWNRTEDPGGADHAHDVALDSSGNMAITGDASTINWRIMYFNSSGVSLWNYTFDSGSVDDVPRAVDIDSNRNVVAVGYQSNDAGRIMYFNSSGVSLWNYTFNFSSSLDVANDVAFDSNRNLAVVGEGDDLWRIFYFNSSDGSILWETTEDPGTFDAANGVDIDSNRNIIVVGNRSGTEWGIRKYEILKNPALCGELFVSNSCNIQWIVNATGRIVSDYLIDVNFSATSSNLISNDTENQIVMIVDYVCGHAVTSNLGLARNHYVNGTCMNANSSNIVVDGRGYTITGDMTGNGAVVEANNITIKNTIFKNFSYGLNLGSYNFTSITNNTIESNVTGSFGIFASSLNSNLTNNTIKVYGENSTGVSLVTSAGNIFRDNFVNVTGFNSSAIRVSSNPSRGIRPQPIANSSYGQDVDCIIDLQSPENATDNEFNDTDTSGFISAQCFGPAGGGGAFIYKYSTNGEQDGIFYATSSGGASSTGIYVYNDSAGAFQFLAFPDDSTQSFEVSRSNGLLSADNLTFMFSVGVEGLGFANAFIYDTYLVLNSRNYGNNYTPSHNNSFVGGMLLSNRSKEIEVHQNQTGNKFTNVMLNNRTNFTSHNISGVAIDTTTAIQADPAGKTNLSYYLNITNLSQSNSWIDFNITYLDSDIPAGMQENTIRMYRYNESSTAWEILPFSSINTALNIVASGIITSFSNFGPLGNSSAKKLDGLIHMPNPNLTSNVAQNGTFTINATVTCSNGACGAVNATVRFNYTGASPGAYVNGTFAEYPFWLYSSYLRQTNYTVLAQGIGSSVSNPGNAFDAGFNDSSTFAETISVATGVAEMNFTFNLSRFYNKTARLFITAAKDAVAAAGDVHIYNFSSGAFVLWFTPTATSATTSQIVLNSSDGFINSTGHVIVRVRSADNIATERVRIYDIHVKAPNTKECGFLEQDETCSVAWTANATGGIGTLWNFDVMFESTDADITDNMTRPSNISIINCGVDFNVGWSVDFGPQTPSTRENAALGNPTDQYNISVHSASCPIDLFIKGTNMTNSSFTTYIGTGNITWSNVSNTYSTSVNLSDSFVTVRENVQALTNVTTWYWLNVPAIYAGIYNGTITISGVESD